jgi:hypothetical protein
MTLIGYETDKFHLFVTILLVAQHFCFVPPMAKQPRVKHWTLTMATT